MNIYLATANEKELIPLAVVRDSQKIVIGPSTRTQPLLEGKGMHLDDYLPVKDSDNESTLLSLRKHQSNFQDASAGGEDTFGVPSWQSQHSGEAQNKFLLRESKCRLIRDFIAEQLQPSAAAVHDESGRTSELSEDSEEAQFTYEAIPSSQCTELPLRSQSCTELLDQSSEQETLSEI